MDLRELVRKRRADILRVASQHGASNVQLFGSVARGDPSPHDIDFLVDYAPGVDLLDAIAFQQHLSDLLGHRVDVVERSALRNPVRARILQEAVAV